VAFALVPAWTAVPSIAADKKANVVISMKNDWARVFAFEEGVL
jgi:hypothetical protein